MKYREILPTAGLQPYVQCYYTFESSTGIQVDDVVFPGGHMEMIFNLGEGVWQSSDNENYHNTPPVELWGKLTQPLAIRSLGKNNMLGIRFHAHSAAYFLADDISRFNDRIIDLRQLLGEPVRTLHAQLLETTALPERIQLIESFLHRRLALKAGKTGHIGMIGQIVRELQQNDSPENMEVIAQRYGISSRYLRKLFLQYTGVSPKFYHKISRFQHSLQLINANQSNLTSITYDCGYFDQSHFIRDFKLFTGITPSDYAPESLPVTQAIAAK